MALKRVSFITDCCLLVDVVDALKNIQDRIRALEVERTTAEENLKDLSKETNFYRQSLERIRQQSPRTPKSVTPRGADADRGGYSTSPARHSPPHHRPASRHQHGIYSSLVLFLCLPLDYYSSVPKTLKVANYTTY